MKRSENSNILSDKRAALSGGLQKYVLNDTVQSFYKFQLEYPEVNCNTPLKMKAVNTQHQ
jgi:hypothetical protein